MIVYVVIKKGVYDHGVMGVFSSLEKAKSVTESFIVKYEKDNYHSYRIEGLELDFTSALQMPGVYRGFDVGGDVIGSFYKESNESPPKWHEASL